MLSVILRWLGTFLGGPFATAAVNAYKAKLAAGNIAEKISADLAAEEAEINAQRDALNAQIIVAEQRGHEPPSSTFSPSTCVPVCRTRARRHVFC